MFSTFLPFGGSRRRSFESLSEQEILALAISSEEDDGRIYRSYAQWLRKDYPDTAKMFDEMAEEEGQHRNWLIDLHREKFGETIPLIRREHVQGFYDRDNAFYREWDAISRDEAALRAWLARWVHGVSGRADYLDLLGAERVAALRPGSAPSGSVDYGEYR